MIPKYYVAYLVDHDEEEYGMTYGPPAQHHLMEPVAGGTCGAGLMYGAPAAVSTMPGQAAYN